MPVMTAADLNARMTGTLSTTLGLVVVEAAPERVVGEFTVKPELTTLESKTNFFAGCKAGKIRAVCDRLHAGRRTSVWQTRLYDESGRMLTQTIQTQMVLMPS